MTAFMAACAAADTQQCHASPPPPPPPGIPEGVTHMFSTPLFRMKLVEPSNAADFFLTLESAILDHFRESVARCEEIALGAGQTPSDRFFSLQRDAFERDEDSFLMLAGGEVAAAFEQLKSGWLQNAQQYVAAAAGEEAAEAFFAKKLHMFVWASVHEGCSVHTPHVHENTAISGVFYISVPDGSGALVLDDPRGLRPPFHRNQISHHPATGELILFPPWLLHSVAPSCSTSGPRISLSFNILSEREGGQQMTDWEVLADTNAVITPLDGD